MAELLPEQPALFEVPDDDAALLLPVEERRKRYTAEQALKLERVHKAVMMLLSAWPVETIAKELHLSTRTVRALAVRSAQEVAGFDKKFADILLRTGARWVALARTKEEEASFRDLMIAAGISFDKARDLVMMGQVGEESVIKESQDHQAAAEALRRMMRAADATSTESEPNAQESEGLTSDGAGDGAGGAAALGPEAGGAGGGSAGGTASDVPMDSRDGGLPAKGGL